MDYIIRTTSFRKRDADPDNVCAKAMIDMIVQSGIIPDDSSKHVSEAQQRVRKTKGEEFTRIEIFRKPVTTT